MKSIAKNQRRAGAPAKKARVDRRAEPKRLPGGRPAALAAVALGVLALGGAGYAAWNNYANRAPNYLAMLEKSPGVDDYRKGIVAEAQGQHDQAIEFFLNALKKDDANAVIYNALATVYVNTGQYQKALVTAENGVAAAPNSPDLYYTLGLARFQTGRYDEASQSLARALELRPDDGNAMLWLGNARLMVARVGSPDGSVDLDRVAAAVDVLRRAVARDDGNAQFHAALGEALYDRRDLEEARDQYLRATELDSQNAGYLVALGKIQDQLGDVDAALDAFSRGAAKDPLSDEAHYGRGLCFFKKEMDAEAIGSLRTAVGINKYNADAHDKLGQALARAGNQAEAESEFALAAESRRQATELQNLRARAAQEPTNAEIASKLGLELAKRGDYEEAMVELQRAVTINPKQVDALYQIGGIYYTKGKAIEAMNAFASVDKLVPGYRRTNVFLSQIYANTGQKKKAEEYEARWKQQQASGTLSES